MFFANKIVCCVRNPLDILASELNFVLTWTHNKKIKQEFHTELKELWEKLVRDEFPVWVSYHRWWINQAKANKVPLYFVRYEDALANPGKSLEEIFAFALELDNLEGTVVSNRIANWLEPENHDKIHVYKPHYAVTKESIGFYTDELLDYIKEQAGDLLYYFGYVSFKDNPTSFIEYERHTEDHLKAFYGFRKQNEEAT